MDDRRLDSLLDEAVADAPPEDVADRVNPWRRSFAFIIWGLVLSTLSFNFYGLNYVQPYAGAALLLLGFRPLRRDNGFFRAAFALCVLRFGLSCAALFAGSSLVRLGSMDGSMFLAELCASRTKTSSAPASSAPCAHAAASRDICFLKYSAAAEPDSVSSQEQIPHVPSISLLI